MSNFDITGVGKFLGASITSFNIAGQWGEMTSNLNVNLVEDLSASPPDDFILKYENTNNIGGRMVGGPVHFEYGNFQLDGILQSYDQSVSVNGDPVYNVVLTTPAKILDAAQVVLYDYVGPANDSIYNSTPQQGGTFGVSNLLNVFGWAENGGANFGRSEVSPVGMYWGSGPSGTAYGIYKGLTTLTNTPPPIGSGLINNNLYFGSYIVYKGYYYNLDLTTLPIPPDYYRIGGVMNMSLLTLITQFCKDAGIDYLVKLKIITDVHGNATQGPHTISFVTVPRYVQPDLGLVYPFIKNQFNLNRYSYGQEIRPDITQAFLVGDSIVFAQPIQNSQESAVIFPFWGFDSNGSAIIGQTPRGTNFADDDHSMYLNGSSIADIFGELKVNTIFDLGGQNGAYLPYTSATFNYQSTVLELRCALAQNDSKHEMDTWLAYIQIYKPDLYNALGLRGAYDINELQNIMQGNGVLRGFECLIDMLRDDPLYARQLAVKYGNNHWPAVAQRIYDFVRSQATKYYGRMFICLLPFQMQIKIIPQTFQVQFNNELSNAGYLPEGSPILGLNYINENFFLDDNGRFVPFVSFAFTNDFYSVGSLTYTPGEPQVVNANLGYIDASNYIVQQAFNPGFATIDYTNDRDPQLVYNGSNSTMIYAKCQQGVESPVSQNGLLGGGSPIIFIPPNNNVGLALPAMVVSIDTPIFAQGIDTLGGADDLAAMFGASNGNLFINGLLGKNGPMNMRIQPPAIYPNGVNITMKSNQYIYGPWGKRRTDGKLEFEQDKGLTPWDCGDYTTMNQVAQAKLQTIATANQVLERAQFTVPDVPQYSLYDTLFKDGPIINSIQCSISDGGVLTTYTLETFVNRVGAFTLENADRLKKIGQIYQQLRRTIRQLIITNTQKQSIVSNFQSGFMYGTTYALQDHTPHAVLMGTLQYSETPPDINNNTNSFFIPFSYTETYQESIGSLNVGNNAYFKTACMGMEGLVRAFTNDVNNLNLPWYFSPPKTTNISAITSNNLNPFQPGMDISWISTGALDSKYNTVNYRVHPSGVDFNTIRAMALRGPMVMCGWGFDIQGLPIPNFGAPSAATGVYYPLQSYTNKFLQVNDPYSDPNDYLSNSINWPTGPVDLRWNKFSSTWASPGMILTGIVSGLPNATNADIGPGGSGYVRLIDNNNNDMDEALLTFNVFKNSQSIAHSGSVTISGYNPIRNRWELLASDCPAQ